MRIGRLIFALAFALLTALAGQPARAQEKARPAKPAKAQGFRQRPQARRRQGANRGQSNPAGHETNGGARQGPNGQASRAGGNDRPLPPANRPGDGVARPPNQDLFKPNPNVVRNLPPGAIERLRNSSPEQQERFLENNQRFQNLPPERQAQIRRNLQKWNSLSPAEKDQMIDRSKRYGQLSPQKQQLYQNQILPKWQQMTQERRQVVLGRLHTLQAMPPSAQQRALNSPQFMQGLTPDEQNVLRNLNTLRTPGPQ
ncbi:MAG TPA: DUF3106 domain-containing protein [Candidatus Cybelea sp.]|nr:DUF3106 domain-containing protein [Candidatus Cybelea sp.]